MLSHDNNELMRQYWIPALPSDEFSGPDCSPKRMRLPAGSDWKALSTEALRAVHGKPAAAEPGMIL